MSTEVTLIKLSAIAAIQADLEAAVADSATAAAASETAAASSATSAGGSATAAAASAAGADSKNTLATAAAAAAAASAAAAGADAIATAADRVQTQSDRSVTAANATAAAASELNADNSANAAGNSATSAGISATAASSSATAAGASASAAASSAAASASSATASANAVAAQFDGEFNATTATLPTTLSAAGKYRVCTAAVTIYGKTWQVGDRAIYNGTASSYTQVPGVALPMASTTDALAGTDTTKAMNAARVSERAVYGDAIRATLDCIRGDGVTSGAKSSHALGAYGDGFGAAGVSRMFPWLLHVPAAAVQSSAGIWRVSVNNAGAISGPTLGLRWGKIDANTLVLDYNDNAGNVRQLYRSGFRAEHADAWTFIHVAFDAAGVKIYVNGTDATSGFTESTTGTPPAWNAIIFDDDFFTVGPWASEKLEGSHVPMGCGPGAWTAAEVATHVQTGRVPSWWQIGTGSMVPAYASNFSAGLDGWVGTGSVRTGNVDGISGRDDNLSFYADNSSGTHYAIVAGVFAGAGKRFRVSFDYFIPAANTNVKKFQTYHAGPAADADTVIPTFDAWTTYSREVTETVASGNLYIYAAAVGGSTFTGANSPSDDLIYIRNVRVIPLGPLFREGLQDGSYQAARDFGGNGLDGLITNGVTALVDGKRRPQIRVKNVNVGTAAYLIQSANVLFPGWDVDCIQISNDGASSAVGVKLQLSDGTTHFDLMAAVTVAAGDMAQAFPTVGRHDSLRRLRCVATSGADNLTFNLSLRKRA